MSREIKFRFYDPFNGTYHYSDSYVSLSRFFLAYHAASEGGNNPALEQFIGLRDKKGIEIYEGDILKCPAYWGGPPSKTPKGGKSIEIVAEVVFDINPRYGAEFLRKEPDWCQEKRLKGGNSTDWYRAECWWDEVEIIGNIHENPELIKEK